MLAQIPEIDKSTEVKAETIKGGFIWGVRFKLPNPAEQDGYIIQKILQYETGTIYRSGLSPGTVSESRANRTIEYWEAWEIKKGETTPTQQQSISDFAIALTGKALNGSKYQVPMNDIYFKNYGIGSVGKYTIKGLAGFYHTKLTPDFVVGHPQTGAGQLKSTTIEPSFWTSKAGLYRELNFTFDFMANITEMKGRISPSTPKTEIFDIRDFLAAFGF